MTEPREGTLAWATERIACRPKWGKVTIQTNHVSGFLPYWQAIAYRADFAPVCVDHTPDGWVCRTRKDALRALVAAVEAEMGSHAGPP